MKSLSLAAGTLVLGTIISSASLKAQSNKVTFEDGTTVTVDISNDNPDRGFKHYTYIDAGIGYQDDLFFQLKFNSAYQLSDNLQAQLSSHLNLLDLSNSQYSLGAYYNISSKLQRKNLKLQVKYSKSGNVITKYVVNLPTLRSQVWQAYLGASYMGYGLDYEYSSQMTFEEQTQFSYFDPYEGYMGSYMLDFGIALFRQRDFVYTVDKKEYRYLAFIRNSLKFHLPLSRNYLLYYNYSDSTTAGITPGESSNVSIAEDLLRGIGVSYELEMNSIGLKIINSSSISLGYYPLLSDNGAFILRITTGYGLGRKNKLQSSQEKLRTFK
jgi:hypothetical protein